MDPGNTGSQPISGTLDPGNTGSQAILGTLDPEKLKYTVRYILEF